MYPLISREIILNTYLYEQNTKGKIAVPPCQDKFALLGLRPWANSSERKGEAAGGARGVRKACTRSVDHQAGSRSAVGHLRCPRGGPRGGCQRGASIAIVRSWPIDSECAPFARRACGNFACRFKLVRRDVRHCEADSDTPRSALSVSRPLGAPFKAPQPRERVKRVHRRRPWPYSCCPHF